MIAVQETVTRDFFQSARSFATKWGPRLVVVTLGAYYGLGIAYELGIMAKIDQIAIRYIKSFFGGGLTASLWVGLLMPGVQSYSAIGVRIAVGFSAGFCYDRLECVAQFAYRKLQRNSPHPLSLPITEERDPSNSSTS